MIKKALLLITLCFFSFNVFGLSSSDLKDVKLIGKGTLSYLFWDVYEVSFLKGEKDNLEAIELHYLRDVAKKHSVSGWKKGLENAKNIENELKWLIDNATDVKEGDKLTIYRYASTNVLIQKNGKTIASKENNKKLHDIVFDPWIGSEPVSESLKKKLLKSQ